MFALSQKNYLTIVRASGVYDWLVTAPFATPWSFFIIRQQLSELNQQLGGHELPIFDSFQLLITCLFGSIVLVWSTQRVAYPTTRLGRFDGSARFIFAFWMAWFLIQTAEPILWLFVIPETLWGIVQWWAIRSTKY